MTAKINDLTEILKDLTHAHILKKKYFKKGTDCHGSQEQE